MHDRIVGGTDGAGKGGIGAGSSIKVREYVAGNQSADAALAQAATILAPAGFDMEIVEKHHNQKVWMHRAAQRWRWRTP